MSSERIPDPVLMARLQLSVKGVDWAASLVQHRQREAPAGGWAPHRHLAHLIATEQNVFQPRLRALLDQDHPQLDDWDGEAHLAAHYPSDEDIVDLADAFMAERGKTVEILKELGEDDWFRTGTWPDGRDVDVAWIAERALWHALDHFAALLKLHNDMEALQAPAWRGDS